MWGIYSYSLQAVSLALQHYCPSASEAVGENRANLTCTDTFMNLGKIDNIPQVGTVYIMACQWSNPEEYRVRLLVGEITLKNMVHVDRYHNKM